MYLYACLLCVYELGAEDVAGILCDKDCDGGEVTNLRGQRNVCEKCREATRKFPMERNGMRMIKEYLR